MFLLIFSFASFSSFFSSFFSFVLFFGLLDRSIVPTPSLSSFAPISFPLLPHSYSFISSFSPSRFLDSKACPLSNWWPVVSPVSLLLFSPLLLSLCSSSLLSYHQGFSTPELVHYQISFLLPANDKLFVVLRSSPVLVVSIFSHEILSR